MKIFVTLLFSILLTSCPNKQIEQDSGITMTSLYKGSLSGSGNIPKQNKVVNSEKDWLAFLEEVHAPEYMVNQLKGKVDFSKNTIIVVVDSRRNTGGFSIEIVKVSNKKGKLIVNIEGKGPKPTDMVTMALTQPIHLVRIPKTNKEIVFVTE